MTGVESYVYDCYKTQEIGWIPRTQALCLNKKNDEDEGEELRKLEQTMENYGTRFDKLTEKLAKLEMMAQKKKSN